MKKVFWFFFFKKRDASLPSLQTLSNPSPSGLRNAARHDGLREMWRDGDGFG
jgi:hypothetical protein